MRVLAGAPVCVYREGAGTWEAAIVEVAVAPQTGDEPLLVFYPTGQISGGCLTPKVANGFFMDAGLMGVPNAPEGRALRVYYISGIKRVGRVLTLKLSKNASAVSGEPLSRFVRFALDEVDDAVYFDLALSEHVFGGEPGLLPPELDLCLYRTLGCRPFCCPTRLLAIIWLLYLPFFIVIQIIKCFAPRAPALLSAPPMLAFMTHNPAAGVGRDAGQPPPLAALGDVAGSELGARDCADPTEQSPTPNPAAAVTVEIR
jgi:hypothetical protein